MIFGLMVVPLMAMTALAIDYANYQYVRSTMQHAADDAALAAVDAASVALQSGAVVDSQTNEVQAAEIQAKAMFMANIAQIKGATLNNVVAVVTKKQQVLAATISFDASAPVMMAGFFGHQTVDLTGVAQAQSQNAVFMNFYMLLDNTPSMGIGATTNDINTMVAKTSDQCGFACHNTSPTQTTYSNSGSYSGQPGQVNTKSGQPYYGSKPNTCADTMAGGPGKDTTDNQTIGNGKQVVERNSYYCVARLNKVTLRIDLVAQAVSQLMTTAQSAETQPNQFGFAIYTFGQDASSLQLQQVQSVTTNLATVAASAKNVSLMTGPYQGFNNDRDTNFDNVFGLLNNSSNAAYIPTSGVGTASSPINYLFFVTDGVADEPTPSSGCTGWSSGSRCQEPINPQLCRALMARGIQIAVIYTHYFPLPTNSWYNGTVAPWVNQVPVNLQACASNPNFFADVGVGQSISGALQTIFNKVLMAHITA
ncbi:MAG: pilus assembly protein [Hyphomicrobiales bacterium]|nr:pilus assembly protein [Hyphomicrobiales bacterium]